MAKLIFECVQSKTCVDEWIVEAIDYGSEGEIYAATFSGPGAEERAREYAAWKNDREERLGAHVELAECRG